MKRYKEFHMVLKKIVMVVVVIGLVANNGYASEEKNDGRDTQSSGEYSLKTHEDLARCLDWHPEIDIPRPRLSIEDRGYMHWELAPDQAWWREQEPSQKEHNNAVIVPKKNTGVVADANNNIGDFIKQNPNMLVFASWKFDADGPSYPSYYGTIHRLRKKSKTNQLYEHRLKELKRALQAENFSQCMFSSGESAIIYTNKITEGDVCKCKEAEELFHRLSASQRQADSRD
jgi:hypothetical protein